jgi:hypothetical protein
VVAYAVYFDHRRRTDPNFRKQLKRESRRQARAAKEEAEAQTIRQREALRTAVEEAKEEGFPTDVEEKEAYFMNEVARGEQLSQDGMTSLMFKQQLYISYILGAFSCHSMLGKFIASLNPVIKNDSTSIGARIKWSHFVSYGRLLLALMLEVFLKQ